MSLFSWALIHKACFKNVCTKCMKHFLHHAGSSCLISVPKSLLNCEILKHGLVKLVNVQLCVVPHIPTRAATEHGMISQPELTPSVVNLFDMKHYVCLDVCMLPLTQRGGLIGHTLVGIGSSASCFPAAK